MTHVNEWRALRDAYAKRAVRSLARLNPAMGVESWQRYIEGAARFPHAHAESLALLAERLRNKKARQHVRRFAALADKVWSLESEAIDATSTVSYNGQKSLAA